MELRFHPAGPSDQQKEQRDVNQNYADPSLVVRLHRKLLRISIHDLAAKFKLFARLIFHQTLELADAAVRKNDQISMAMDIADFSKPWRLWPLVRRSWLVVE